MRRKKWYRIKRAHWENFDTGSFLKEQSDPEKDGVC